MARTTHKLSAVEDFFRREDRADSPMVITMRVHLAGVVDVSALTNALADALQRHPLLRATCEGKWQPHWVVRDCCGPNLIVHAVASPPSADCPERKIDLARETGAVFELRHSADRAVLLAWFHHQCVDGLGALQFLRDTCAAYDAIADGDHKFTPSEPLSIPHRRIATQTPGSIVQALRIGASVFTRKCVRLASTQAPDSAEGILHTRVLNQQTARSLRKIANRSGVSLNDVCLSAYLQQLNSFSRRVGSDADLFRILVPVSMRTPEHDNNAAGNVISFLFQSYTREQIEDTDQLLRVVHRQTDGSLREEVGRSVLLFFQLARHIPGAYQLFRMAQNRFATAVFANVGDLKRIFDHRFERHRGRAVSGGLVIDRIDGVAPLRENTNLAVSFGRYAGELIFNLRANPRFISQTDAAEFLQEFVNRLRSLADCESPTAQSTPSQPDQLRRAA